MLVAIYASHYFNFYEKLGKIESNLMNKIIRFIFSVDKANTDREKLNSCERCRLKVYHNL